MVTLPSIGDVGLPTPTGDMLNMIFLFVLIIMLVVIFILLGWFIWHFLTYKVFITIFDGMAVIKTKAKDVKRKGILKLKLRARKNWLVVQPEKEHYYYKKGIFGITKHLFFNKVNDILLPSMVNVNEESSRNVKVNVGKQEEDGTVIDFVLPINVKTDPVFDTTEISLRPFLAQELAWADENYKELKSGLLMILPYALVFIGMMLSFLMVIITINKVG